jgi:hypothetical protein
MRAGYGPQEAHHQKTIVGASTVIAQQTRYDSTD